MVDESYKTSKEKSKTKVQKATAVGLISDMWTSMNMDAYLAVTCYFMEEGLLNSIVLGLLSFPPSHTADHLACVKASLMEPWGISNKVTCLVTDGATNMIACAKVLRLQHTICVIHSQPDGEEGTCPDSGTF